MSKVVILEAQLGVSKIINDLSLKFATKNPDLARWLEKIDSTPIITECVKKSIQRLKESDVQTDNQVLIDGAVYTDNYRGMQIIGVLKTDKLPTGLGVIINRGKVKFAADGNRSGSEEEAKRLQDLFEKIFLQEIVKAFLQVFGYKFKAVETTAGSEPAIFIKGVKQ